MSPTTALAADCARLRLSRAHAGMTGRESRANALQWADYAEAQQALLREQQGLIEKLDINRGLAEAGLRVVQGAVQQAMGMFLRGHWRSAASVLALATTDLIADVEPTAIPAVDEDLPGYLFAPEAKAT